MFHIKITTGCDLSTEEWQALSAKYQEAVTCFQEAYELMQSRAEFDVPQVDEYQRAADKFYSQWIELTGREGITNYVHSIGSGHLRYFLLLYRNLYKYSQQGWEHHNKRLLGIYHRHSQRGGNGAMDEDKGHILPLFCHEVRVGCGKQR